MRIVIAKLEFKRETDRVRNLTGQFWVVYVMGEPAYRCESRAQALSLVSLLGESL